MHAIFNKEDRMTGWTTVPFSTSNESRTVVETSEKDLKSLIPDSFEGDWKEYRRKFKLENGEIVFEESYTPKNKVE